MDSKQVELLLEKYWNAETSLEEEQQLREYFHGDEIPAQWKEAAELFRYFEFQRNEPLKAGDFDANVLKKIKHDQPRRKSVRLFANALRIAAGLAVVVAATYFVRTEIRKSYPAEDTFSDPKMAFEETKKALRMIGKGFGKGQREASKINVFNAAEKKVQGKEEKKKENI